MLEIARQSKNGPVKRKHIALTQEISAHYLENILISLKSSNLIRTVRGAKGGFYLESPPEDISMYQIITALEGSIAPVHCLESPDNCNRANGCVARGFWQELLDVQVELLKKTSLQTLLDSEKPSVELNYNI